MKGNFLRVVRLYHVIPGETFKLQTDASDLGVCGILYQTDNKGDRYLISVVSRCLTKAEVRYTTTEKELLAVVYAVSKFRTYLIGGQFEIITDHRCLTFLSNVAFGNSRLLRWALFLQQYSFTITYCRGKDNLVADFYSRNPDGSFHENSPRNLVIALLSPCMEQVGSFDHCVTALMIGNMGLDAAVRGLFNNIRELQQADTYVRSKMSGLTGREDDRWRLYDDLLFIRFGDDDKWRLCIPLCLVTQLVDNVHHRLGHAGVYKTKMFLQRYFYWQGLARDVK